MVAACMRRTPPRRSRTTPCQLVAAGKCNDVPRSAKIPSSRRHLIRAIEEATGFQVTMSPAPVTTEWLREHDMTMASLRAWVSTTSACSSRSWASATEEYEELRAEGVI